MNRNSEEGFPIMKERDPDLNKKTCVVLFKGLLLVYKDIFYKLDHAIQELLPHAS